MSLSPATSSLHSRWISLFLARLSVTIDALFILGGVGAASADRWFAMSGDAWLQTIYIAFHFARCAGLHKITNYSCTIILLQIVVVSSKNNESSTSLNCVTFFHSGYIRIRIIILIYIFAIQSHVYHSVFVIFTRFGQLLQTVSLIVQFPLHLFSHIFFESYFIVFYERARVFRKNRNMRPNPSRIINCADE